MKDKYLAIYSRKSKFTGKGESIKNQIEKCQNYLKLKYTNEYQNIKNNIKIYSDEGYTGYNINRPKFQKLLSDIEKGAVKTIIVYKLDRISRNVTDFCNLKDKFQKYNIDFISVTENFDTSTPLGNAMIMISSIFAQLERDTIAERIKDNMYELAKTGRWLGGNTPLGFNSIKKEFIDNTGKKRNIYQLEPNYDEIKIIKLLWDKMIELKGIHKLESYLIQNNIKTRNNNYFTRFSLTNIFKNPVYVIADNKSKAFFEKQGVTIYNSENINNSYGLISYNKRKEKKGKNNDIKDWIIAVGKHQGLIDSSRFIEVWTLITQNKDKRLRTPRQNESILSGIIKCKYCGSYMRPRLRKTYNKNGKRNFSYLCELKDKSRKKLCTCQNIDGIDTDKLILQKISNLKVPKELLIQKLKKYINDTKEPDKISNEMKNLKTMYQKNKIKIENLINKLADIDNDILKDVTIQIKKLKQKNKNIKIQINKLENNKNSLSVNQINDYLNIILKNKNNFNNLNLLDRRKLLRLIVTKVESDGKNIYIYY